MARIDHRTPEYNTTANPVHLQGTFAIERSFNDLTFTPIHCTEAYRITRYYKDNYDAVERMMQIFRKSRVWYQRERNRAPLHPTIAKMLKNPEQAQYLTDWREMLLEYPHVADLDATKIAFTENEAKGVADRQTVTTLGKYIKRHAPNIPDHVLRDMVMLSVAEVTLVYDLQGMIDAVQNGPRSCMQGGFRTHPYNVYDPKYGWHMAVRREGDAIVGRCLCLEHDGRKMFVRSYRTNEGYSQSDEGMNAWLEERGYIHASGWPNGAQVAAIRCGGDLVLPYFDGNNDNCNDCGDYLIMDDCGEYSGDNTNGFASGGADRCSCDDCGDYFNDGDGTWVGRHEDRHVCDDCSSGYTYAYGRRGHQYYVSDDDVISVGYEYYDSNYLSDNNIVYCEHDDSYHDMDDCTVLETGEWVHNDDIHNGDFVCLDEDNSIWAHKSDCWQCAGTDLWYSDDTGSDYYAQSWTGADGKLYHGDDLPEADKAAVEVRTALTYDEVCTAAFNGVTLHCYHVHQYIDHTWI